MKWRIDKNSKIEPLIIPDLPEYITGRLRKDGKPDKRYKNGMYMLQEYLKQASGNSSLPDKSRFNRDKKKGK